MRRITQLKNKRLLQLLQCKKILQKHGSWLHIQYGNMGWLSYITVNKIKQHLSLQRCCQRAVALCCGERRTNVNCSNQSRHQTTLSLHSFLRTHRTTIFHSDSSNYYRSPLSFSWHFFPDMPSIINCHITKFQQRMYIYLYIYIFFFLSCFLVNITVISAQINCCVVTTWWWQACLIRELFIMVMDAFQKQHLGTFALQVL